MRKLVRTITHSFGLNITRYRKYPEGLEQDIVSTYEKVQPFTMTGILRVNSLIHSIRYLEKNNIKGDIVECGVWRGGSAMAAALELVKHRSFSRHLYLYDTFAGMSSPSEVDVTSNGAPALKKFIETTSGKDSSHWCYSPLDEVKQNLIPTGYPEDKITYVQGKVEDTIPSIVPESIALLRLDTDWYESTKHELVHLFPLLVPGGILIVDDYGHWTGAKKAVDEYVEENNITLFLERIDYTGRSAVKISQAS